MNIDMYYGSAYILKVNGEAMKQWLTQSKVNDVGTAQKTYFEISNNIRVLTGLKHL